MAETDLIERVPTGRGGKPKVAITDAGLELIAEQAGAGNDPRTIAKALGIPYTTFLGLRDRDEAVQEALARGHGTLADELTHHLLKAARGGNVTAAIYLTKARLGWIEGQLPEGASKTAVQVNIQIPRAMSDAEFRRIVGQPGEAGSAPSLPSAAAPA